MKRIETSSLEFIKIEPRGHAVQNKFWVRQDGIYKLVKPSSENVDQDVIEAITSKILSSVGINCVSVTLGYDSILKKNCCLVNNFLAKEGDTLYEMLEWSNTLDLNDSFNQVFYRYSRLYGITLEELENLKRDYIRIIFGKCLTENIDSKLDNIGLIYNEQTNLYRLPPSYDNGLSFRSYNSASKPSCFIGNQLFEIEEVVDYIVNNYYDYISDIVPLIDNLDDNILEMLEEFDIDLSKKEYIIGYVKKFIIKIKENEKSK